MQYYFLPREVVSRMYVCPISKSRLLRMSLEEAEDRAGSRLDPALRTNSSATPIGRSDYVYLREDLVGAYPTDPFGTPVLMGPEILVPPHSGLTFNLDSDNYAEAYAEMSHYESLANQDHAKMVREGLPEALQRLFNITPEQAQVTFPQDWEIWLDAPYDCISQWECYKAIGSLKGTCVSQLGGSGLHAVKFLLGGASQAVLISPMLSELRLGRLWAEKCGVGDRLVTVAAIAEELPIADATFDAIFSGGCLHHMQTHVAAPEIRRVLSSSGVFAAVEPWRAPLYKVGTTIFGQRENGASCSPLTPERVAPLRSNFRNVQVTHHGAITRYFGLVLSKAGIDPSLRRLFRLFQVDDWLTSRFSWLQRQGSSVSVICRN